MTSPLSREAILATEYSAEFDELRKNRMAVSFFKYGPLQTNYSEKLIDSIKSLERYLHLYRQTGNTEYLADVANFAMIEFMCPQHPDAHFEAVDDGKSNISGMGVNQLKAFDDVA